MKKFITLPVILLFLTFSAKSQTAFLKNNLQLISGEHQLRFANLHPAKMLEGNVADDTNNSTTEKQLSTFRLAVSERLPVFCAMEKKLNALCNVWIRIRLPEKGRFSSFPD